MATKTRISAFILTLTCLISVIFLVISGGLNNLTTLNFDLTLSEMSYIQTFSMNIFWRYYGYESYYNAEMKIIFGLEKVYATIIMSNEAITTVSSDYDKVIEVINNIRKDNTIKTNYPSVKSQLDKNIEEIESMATYAKVFYGLIVTSCVILFIVLITSIIRIYFNINKLFPIEYCISSITVTLLLIIGCILYYVVSPKVTELDAWNLLKHLNSGERNSKSVNEQIGGTGIIVIIVIILMILMAILAIIQVLTMNKQSKEGQPEKENNDTQPLSPIEQNYVASPKGFQTISAVEMQTTL